MLGYLEHTRGYRLYDTEAKKVFRCRDVVFYEDETTKTNYQLESTNNSEEDDNKSDSVGDCTDNTEESFETTSEKEDNPDTKEEIIEISDEDPTQHVEVQEDEPEPQLHRSSRTPKPRNWLDYISFKMESTRTEPLSVHEALNGSHSKV